jgi:hypothetical protein
MRVTTGFALREVRQAYVHLVQQMELMNNNCQIKPSDGNVIQSVNGGDNGVRLQCKPVVCRVPERASQPSLVLYVVFTGLIAFSEERVGDRLMTATYSTNFAYFEASTDSAAHVLGGHYDFSPAQVGHPRAHMQLRSQADMYPDAQSNFRSITNVPLEVDHMRDVLTRVRAPSAQMDFLSFMLQVAADHLVDEKSRPQVVSIFEDLASSCSPLLGYHANLVDDCGCHRAPHWY